MKNFKVAIGYGENVQSVNEFQTVDNVEATTAYDAAVEIWNGLEQSEEQDIIFQVHPEDSNEVEYFVEEDFR